MTSNQLRSHTIFSAKSNPLCLTDYTREHVGMALGFVTIWSKEPRRSKSATKIAFGGHYILNQILRWSVFTGRVGPSIPSTRFISSPLSYKMFSSFVSDVDEVLEPYPPNPSGGPSPWRTRHPFSLAVSLGDV
ncbi:hypothetical protein RB195_018203 [Necator americanus]|uniref:Uncharacterized protein n=1 Tax=Necator americanus TaxID=51031 RepID=A0ABR1C8P9_NECAM